MANKTINYVFSRFFEQISKNKQVLIWAAISCIIGVSFGIILLYGEKSYLGLISTSNQNMLGYISGKAEIFKLFFSRLSIGMFSCLVLFLVCLHHYSSFLGFLYLAYQSAICTIACGTLISYQGLSAIINSIFLIIPSNIILLSLLAIYFSILYDRAKLQYKYSYTFQHSFHSQNNLQNILVCIALIFLLYVVVGIVIPLVIKGIYLIYY